MQLRDYQLEAVDSIFSYFQRSEGAPVVALPTGTGKSVVIAGFLARAFDLAPSSKVLVLTHDKKLIKQNYKALLRAWPLAPAGIYSAGLNSRDHAQAVIFAGIQSVWTKAELFGHVDAILIDEAHLVDPNAQKRYGRFIRDVRKINSHVRIVGFTATPYRSSGLITEGKDRIFTDICYDRTQRDAFNSMIEEGWIAPLTTKRTRATIDPGASRVRNGDYVPSDLEKIILANTPNLIAAVDETIAEGLNRNHWLVFTVSIKHCELVAQLFRDRGIKTVVAHSERPANEQDAAIAAWTSGEARCLVNVAQLTTGFDFPALDLIAFMRPTRSVVLYVQMAGRAMRTHASKSDGLILDFGRVIETLGPVNDPIIPGKSRTVEDCPDCGRYRVQKDAHGLPIHDGCPSCGKRFFVPVKACPSCSYYCATAATICPNCGQEFPRETKITHTAASDIQIIAGKDPPKPIEFPVASIELSITSTKSGRNALRIQYRCGVTKFVEEWVNVEHDLNSMGFFAAKRWMLDHGLEARSESAYELRGRALTLAKWPVKLFATKNGKYWKICEKVFEANQPPVRASKGKGQ